MKTLKDELKETISKALEIAEMMNDDNNLINELYHEVIELTCKIEKL